LIEVKGPGKHSAQVTERILELADDFSGPLIVQSFNSRFLAKFKQSAPDITTGICSRQPDIVQRALKARCQGVHFAWLSLAATALGAARKHGLQVFAWTAKRRRDIEIILHLDVDGIITDCPDVLQQRLKAR
jgi:glycerophosphoryl diester phosphodiesterase